MTLKEYKLHRHAHLTNAQSARRMLHHPWLDDQTRGALESSLRRERGELLTLRAHFWGQHRLAV